MNAITPLVQLLCGAALVAGGGVLWALTGAGEAGAAMIGAGGAMLPGALAGTRSNAA